MDNLSIINTEYPIIIFTEEEQTAKISNIVSNQQLLKLTKQEFRYYPKHICISDTYNNPYYPWHELVFDKYTFDLPKYKSFLEKNYFGTELDFLPFHFIIEYVQDDYYVFNTRPINLPPVIEKNTKDYNSLWVIIMGDTNKDIYPSNFQYKLFNLLHSLYSIISRIHSTIDRNQFIQPRNIDIRKVLRNEFITKITTASS